MLLIIFANLIKPYMAADEKPIVTVRIPGYQISVIGEVLCIVISFFVLKIAGRAVFSPLEEADRKQKKFISGVDKEFGLPLTVINANTEIIERKHGPDEQTNSIRRQVKKLGQLVEKISAMGIFDDEKMQPAPVDLSDLLHASIDCSADSFASAGIAADKSIESGVTINADPEAMKQVIDELIANAAKYSVSKVLFSLKREGDRVVMQSENDARLPDGSCDQVFDRFTKLENAADNDSAGLGLSYVKDMVMAHDGRVNAVVSGGRFILRIAL